MLLFVFFRYYEWKTLLAAQRGPKATRGKWNSTHHYYRILYNFVYNAGYFSIYNPLAWRTIN